MYEHIVIGAGINGSSAAYQLARRGRRVLLLEKFPLPHSRGSSHGQSRGIRKAYPDPFFTRLMERAYTEWREIEEDQEVELIRKTGLLCFSEEAENEHTSDVIKAFEATPGAKFSTFYGKDFRDKFPYLRLGPDGHGCYDPEGGILLADKALRAIQDMAVKFGAKIVDGFDVDTIRQEGDIVSVTSKTGVTHSAPSLVLCPGPWASEMLSKIGLRLPLIPWKIPVYYWRVSQFLPHTFIYDCGKAREGHVWGLPEQEYPGLVKICLHEGVECDPDSRDKADTQNLKRFLEKFIGEKFPGVEPRVSVEESCMYTMTPDENPVIDTVPGTNIVIGVGFSGTGFKLGPVTGAMLADLATKKDSRQETEMLSLRRFPKNATFNKDFRYEWQANL